MNMKLISVVMPVFNVKKYLSDSIESVLRQTYTNFELIIVDDGSNDGSENICDQYASLEKVFVYHKDNGGLSSARNYGIDRANGDFLTFIDSDDCWDDCFLEKLYNSLDKYDADIAMCRYTRRPFTKNKKESVVYKENKEVVLKKILYQKSDSLYSVAAWNKMYRKSLFDNLRYPIGKINEDMFVICELILNANAIVVCDYEGYFYRVNSQSITQQQFKPRNMDVVEACEHIMDYVNNNCTDKAVVRGANNIFFRRNFQMFSMILKSKDNYSEQEDIVYSNLKKTRKSVMWDFNSKIGTKIAAISLFMPKSIVKTLVKMKG